MMPTRLAFVDLETTGGIATHDRITEVGMVLVDRDGMREWRLPKLKRHIVELG